MFTFEVDKNEIRMTEAETITSGSVDIYLCQFTFSSDWDGLAKTITFRTDDTSISIILDSTNICSIPWEVMTTDAVQLYCGVRGTVTDTDTEEEAIIPTVYCLLGTIRKGTELGDNAQPPVPSVVDQIMNRIEALDEGKQDKLTGQPGQVVSFDENGNVIARDEKGTEYKAGENISISADNTISAKMYDDTEIRVEIDNVKSKTEANTEGIAKNAAGVAANAEAIAANSADIAANAEAIVKNTADISKNAENIAKNTESIAGNAANIAKNSADIAKNTAGLKTVGDKVDTLNTSFSTLSKSVTDNTTAINTAEENIAALSLSVTEAGRKIAKNAAGLSAANEEISTLKDSKQDKLHGNEGQVVGFDKDGNAIAQDGGAGTPGKDGVTFTPMVSESGIISWSNDGGRENPEPMNIKGEPGPRGVTFTPTVSPEGIISWENDGGLDNPAPANIKGPAGAYTAGANISISEDNVISAAAYDDTEIRGEIHDVKTTADNNTKAIATNSADISANAIEITRVETFADEIAATAAKNSADISTINSSLEAVDKSLQSKQDKLTAGDNIHIENNVVSADMYDDTAILASISSLTTSKQDKLTAGDNVHIENNVVSADMYDDSEIRGEISAQSATISEHSISINANTAAIAGINTTLASKQDKLTAGTGISISGDTIALSDTASTKKLATGSLTSFGGVTVTSVNGFTLNRQTSNLSLISEYIHTDATSYTKFETYYGYLEAYLTADADKTLSTVVPMYLNMSHSISFPGAVGFAIIKVSTMSRYIAMAESSRGIIRLCPTQSVSVTAGANITVYLYLR